MSAADGLTERARIIQRTGDFKGKRFKPKREDIARTRPAQRADFQRLAEAIKIAVINRQWEIEVVFPWFVKFKDKTFPHGVLVERTPTTNVYRMKTRKVLDWLYDKGYTAHNTKMLIEATYAHNYRLSLLERALEGEIE